MTWNWETFPQYLDELDRMARVVDVSALVPHGAVRAYVMGDRGGQNAEATVDEIEAMAKVVREAVEAGAVGFSTTRTLLHRAKDGELAAGTTASADELIGIGMALGEAGAGVFELASDMFDPAAEFAWMTAIARQTGRPVTFNCLQDDLRPEHWRRLIELADDARAAGANIVPQVAGRPASVLFGWDSTAHPFMFHHGWQALAGLPRDERQARLRDPDVRRALVDERPELAGMAAFVTSAFHKLFPLGDPPEYEPAPDRSVQAVAEREGRTPQEVTYDLMMADDGRGLLYIPILGYAHGDFGALHDMLVHPGTVLGLGDGGAHCGLLCDASLPTFMLTHWVRDRGRGDRLGLEQAVHMQTRSTAALYGFDDPGLPGRRQRHRLRRADDRGARDGVRPAGRGAAAGPAGARLRRHRQAGRRRARGRRVDRGSPGAAAARRAARTRRLSGAGRRPRRQRHGRAPGDRGAGGDNGSAAPGESRAGSDIGCRRSRPHR
jgi:N-acyl-D-aspartate/D-glutamate deacylase